MHGNICHATSSMLPRVSPALTSLSLTPRPFVPLPLLPPQLSLRGSADAVEGLSLDELKLVVGQAQLSARGLLLGQQQDASFSLTDFPAVLLQPLFSALPALQVGIIKGGACLACMRT